jgi:hypothetical protein
VTRAAQAELAFHPPGCKPLPRGGLQRLKLGVIVCGAAVLDLPRPSPKGPHDLDRRSPPTRSSLCARTPTHEIMSPAYCANLPPTAGKSSGHSPTAEKSHINQEIDVDISTAPPRDARLRSSKPRGARKRIVALKR